MKKYIIVFSIILLSACAAKTPVKTEIPKVDNTAADVERAQAFYPGMNAQSLLEAKSLYEVSCGNCHALKKPAAETEQEWRAIMPKMVIKANKKGASLTPENEKQLLAYVLTMRTAQ